MANVITWVQTQNQEKLAGIGKYLERKVMPKTPQFKVLEKLEKAYQENNIEKLIFWLAYANFYGFTVTEGRKFFKKIEELWPSGHHRKLANAFLFLNKIYAEAHNKRSDSAQIYNHCALAAEFSQV